MTSKNRFAYDPNTCDLEDICEDVVAWGMIRVINQEGVTEETSELKVTQFTQEMRPIGKPKRQVIVPEYTKAQLDATFVARDDTKIVWYKGEPVSKSLLYTLNN